MNAFLLLCQCDSIANKVFAKAIPVIQETYKAGTNCSDVKIADAICKSLVLIFAICVAGFLIWKLIDHIAIAVSGLYKRKCDVEDKKLKQKSDLIDKLTDFLTNQTQEKDNEGKVTKYKPYNNPECVAYRAIICDLLVLLQNKKFDVNTLKTTMNNPTDPDKSSDKKQEIPKQSN